MPKSKVFSIRIGTDLMQDVRNRAEREERTLTSVVTRALREYVQAGTDPAKSNQNTDPDFLSGLNKK